MKRILFVALLVSLLIVACAPAGTDQQAMDQQSTEQQSTDQKISLTVYRAPT